MLSYSRETELQGAFYIAVVVIEIFYLFCSCNLDLHIQT